MRKSVFVILGILALLGLSSPHARAGGHFAIGIGVGVPGPYYYHRPYYDYDYYYRPYPVYVAPPPVIVQPAPVVQTVPAPVVTQAPAPAPVVVRSPVPEASQAEVERCLQQLADPDERVRADNVIQLGRLKAEAAVDPLAATLAGDRSPTVRETAARALGLIGSPRALPALEHAAQADSDSQVRHSAQFATEVVLSNRPQ
jgi:hypothetical protein